MPRDSVAGDAQTEPRLPPLVLNDQARFPLGVKRLQDPDTFMISNEYTYIPNSLDPNQHPPYRIRVEDREANGIVRPLAEHDARPALRIGERHRGSASLLHVLEAEAE